MMHRCLLLLLLLMATVGDLLFAAADIDTNLRTPGCTPALFT